jgi:hypothetical protein
LLGRRVLLPPPPIPPLAKSGRSRVAVVQATQVRPGNNLPLFGWLHGSCNRGIPLQRQMRAGFVVVREVLGQNAAQVLLVQHYHVIQALAADRADDSFSVRILPRSPWRK